MIDFLIDVIKIAFCVFLANKLMFWYYRKKEFEYYKDYEKLKREADKENRERQEFERLKKAQESVK